MTTIAFSNSMQIINQKPSVGSSNALSGKRCDEQRCVDKPSMPPAAASAPATGQLQRCGEHTW